MQRPGPHGDEPSPEVVAPVRPDDPPGGLSVPRELLDLGGEQRPPVEVELPGDALGMGEDLRGERVLHRRHVTGLLEEREVDHRRRVTHRTRVAIPVPGASHVAAALDEPEIVDPGLAQASTGDEPGEAAADDRHGHLLADSGSILPLHVRVVEQVGEPPGRLQVLVVPVGSETLVPLGAVPGSERLPVDGAGHDRRHPAIPVPWPAPGLGEASDQ